MTRQSAYQSLHLLRHLYKAQAPLRHLHQNSRCKSNSQNKWHPNSRCKNQYKNLHKPKRPRHKNQYLKNRPSLQRPFKDLYINQQQKLQNLQCQNLQQLQRARLA